MNIKLKTSVKPVVTGCFSIYEGTTAPNIMAMPKIEVFLDECKSINRSVDIPPTPPAIDNDIVKIPPMIGSGMVAKMAPNLVNNPSKIKMHPANCIVRRLATWICIIPHKYNYQ